MVNDESPRLASTDVSADITSDQPVVVERSMYLTAGGKIYEDSATLDTDGNAATSASLK